MTNEEVRVRIARGAALLDEKRPGWAAKVDTDELMMSDSLRCVLGQLYGSYSTGLNCLRLVDTPGYSDAATDPVTYGFQISGVEVSADLRAAWFDAITERVAPPVTWTHREPQQEPVTS